MRRNCGRQWLFIGACALAAMAVAAPLMVSPDIEGAERELWGRFAQLEQMKAYVIGAKGEFLGEVSRTMDTNSLGNAHGKGSQFDSNGLFNQFSDFGSEFSATSAFGRFADKPPRVVVKERGEVREIGVLTVNPHAPVRTQRINPHLLRAWLSTR
jgi:hypothetical protein